MVAGDREGGILYVEYCTPIKEVLYEYRDG